MSIDKTIDAIFKRPNIYFAHGEPTNDQLVCHVTQDMLYAGAAHIETLRAGSYTAMRADIDWLKSAFADFDELFDRIVPVGEKSPNSMRAEILLRATCSELMVCNGGPAYSFNMSPNKIPVDLSHWLEGNFRTIFWKFRGWPNLLTSTP